MDTKAIFAEEGNLYIKLLHRGYDPEKSIFYYRSRNDKETDLVLRCNYNVEKLIRVCYDLRSPKAEQREVNSLIEYAEELKCSQHNLILLLSVKAFVLLKTISIFNRSTRVER